MQPLSKVKLRESNISSAEDSNRIPRIEHHHTTVNFWSFWRELPAFLQSDLCHLSIFSFLGSTVGGWADLPSFFSLGVFLEGCFKLCWQIEETFSTQNRTFPKRKVHVEQWFALKSETRCFSFWSRFGQKINCLRARMALLHVGMRPGSLGVDHQFSSASPSCGFRPKPSRVCAFPWRSARRFAMSSNSKTSGYSR